MKKDIKSTFEKLEELRTELAKLLCEEKIITRDAIIRKILRDIKI